MDLLNIVFLNKMLAFTVPTFDNDLYIYFIIIIYKTLIISTKIVLNKKKANDDFGILSIQSFEANANLIRHLVGKYVIEYVIGHSEYGELIKSKLWRETDPSYFTGKEDPGTVFMQKVRDKIKDLSLRSLSK